MTQKARYTRARSAKPGESKLNIVGHIGMRSGSKGVPGKNTRLLLGKPLVDWSIELIRDHPQISAWMVSTDDEAVYKRSVDQGGLAIGPRPSNLAQDDTPKWLVWQHALEAAEKLVGKVDIFVDIDCTHPLRIPEDVTDAIELFKRESPEMVMSVCESRKNPYFNQVEPDGTGSLRVVKPLPNGIWSRQQAPVVYDHVGVVYVVSASYLRTAQQLYEGRVIPYIVPLIRAFDIDTEDDWRLVERLMSHY